MTEPAAADAASGRRVLVVAHPDDEALWFSSVLREADLVVICFRDVGSDPACSAGRRRVLDAYPLPMTCLGLAEAETFGTADWRAPRETGYGLRLRRRRQAMPGFSPDAYRANYGRLCAGLRPLLAGAGCVYTHAPWGEYGHEDHVQVFRAVDALRAELGFELRFGLYASEKSLALFARYWPALPPPRTRGTDAGLAAQLCALYRQHRCWTWYPDYAWPREESFVAWSGPSQPPRPRGATLPVSMVRVGWQAGGSAAGVGRLRAWLGR